MNLNIAILKFPGTTCDRDVFRALKMIPNAEPEIIQSTSRPEVLNDAKGIIIPSGYAFADYVRPGALAAYTDIIDKVIEKSAEGRPILGISNGFQILVEIGLLPGVLLHNVQARFVCKWVFLRVCEESTLFTEALAGLVIKIPIAHEYGNYHCPKDILEELLKKERVAFRYCNTRGEANIESNPNGSLDNIAGIVNDKGNVLGMMPQPERACRTLIGSADGLSILENFVNGVVTS